MSNDARRHHYVSACYLRHFAVPADRYGGRLWVYDRTTGSSWLSSPDGSAHQHDFYRVEIEGAHPNLIENTYEALETRFAPTLATVIERGVLPSEPRAMRELLAFVASQATRTPRVRDMQTRWMSDVQQLINDLSPKRNETLELSKSALIRDALEAAPELEDMLARRHWILGRSSDGSKFITTDDPVFSNRRAFRAGRGTHSGRLHSATVTQPSSSRSALGSSSSACRSSTIARASVARGNMLLG